MAKHIHKRFTNEQVKDLMKRYEAGEVSRVNIETILEIGKSRFFTLIKAYRDNPESFDTRYNRRNPTRCITQKVEKRIIQELNASQKLINAKNVPIGRHNYSFIRQTLHEKDNQSVALSTIIKRAKEHGFYIPRKKTSKPHDREVITNNIGELIQHDSSQHLFAPKAGRKWWLITSIDDHSRFMFYAKLVAHDTTWPHVVAVRYIFLKFGLPLRFYIDSDSIFRFVRGRDELHYKHHQFTDEVRPQWTQILDECQVKPVFALSPQAKGKIERPYGWLQDHLVRLCYRENITSLAQGNHILGQEVNAYNFKRVHSAVEEIPYLRYQRAIRDKRNLFRQFRVPEPFQSTKDIFCIRMDRTVDAYRCVTINNQKIKFSNAPIYEKVQLRIHPNTATGISEIRFWHKGKLLDIQMIKTTLIDPVHF
ncbi:MAG: hypothetical protein WC329_07000 [Candidatus Omnitrophota bacterium]|jgi:hypothetical protein